MPGLTRDQIIAAIAERHHQFQAVEVPEWGGAVYIRTLSAAELEETGALTDGESGTAANARVLAACMVDSEGNTILAPEDAVALADAEMPVFLRLVGAAAKRNGLSNKALEEAVATFGVAQDDASFTD